MKKTFVFVLTILLICATGAAYAGDACLYGSAVNSDGSKIDGSATVSTSWNSRKAFPKNGKYRLCLGSNPGKSITVYVDGSTYTSVYVNGNTRLNIVRR